MSEIAENGFRMQTRIPDYVGHACLHPSLVFLLVASLSRLIPRNGQAADSPGKEPGKREGVEQEARLYWNSVSCDAPCEKS